jgi:hypothetical protein
MSLYTIRTLSETRREESNRETFTYKIIKGLKGKGFEDG